MKKTALETTRADNFADWYQAVIKASDMAEHSGVRGCMTIKPWGYRIWERTQELLDREIKRTGHENCYFPLFIPIDLIQKEADHVEGFAKEMAVVTHHRLVVEDGQLVPSAPLEKPLIVRPTSETMIGEAFSRWIQSYRDLPLKINQWANVVRWEMRPRLFLRTSEFLWQEGHTAHATAEEAIEETRTMLGVYQQIVEGDMLIPVIPGTKSESERFPGADDTHTIEAMMQDGRALQSGTSHYLGQNFSKAADISFQDKDGETRLVHTTSWGASTRLIGAMIMTHGDDNGLRLPPSIAPQQVVIVPVLRDESSQAAVLEACETLAEKLRGQIFRGEPVRAIVDLRDDSAATKRWNWIKKGVPLICEIGPRDLAEGKTAVTSRVDPALGRRFLEVDAFAESITEELQGVANTLWGDAAGYRDQMSRSDIESLDDFKAFFEKGNGFIRAKWCGSAESESVLDDLGVTIRCLPYDQSGTQGRCILTGKPATIDAIFARAY